jgi:hypothetical protein
MTMRRAISTTEQHKLRPPPASKQSLLSASALTLRAAGAGYVAPLRSPTSAILKAPHLGKRSGKGVECLSRFRGEPMGRASAASTERCPPTSDPCAETHPTVTVARFYSSFPANPFLTERRQNHYMMCSRGSAPHHIVGQTAVARRFLQGETAVLFQFLGEGPKYV